MHLDDKLKQQLLRSLTDHVYELDEVISEIVSEVNDIERNKN